MPTLTLRRTIAVLPLLLCAAVSTAPAQRSTAYPTQIYNGGNVINVSHPRGIERITATASGRTTVSVPTIGRCPTQVTVNATVNNAYSNEKVVLTVFDCGGGITTLTLLQENWDIRHERTGMVEIGRDTCLRCVVDPRGGEPKVVDSITVDDPRLSVKVPYGAPPWRAPSSGEFQYSICFKPDAVGQIERTIRLYIRREQPNGGLTNYVIEKPISAIGVAPPERPALTGREPLIPEEPPLVDPTTFRSIIVPTAETIEQGTWYAGTYDVVGLTAGYGVTRNLTVTGFGAWVPPGIAKLAAGGLLAKYRLIDTGLVQLAAGGAVGISSTEQSDISVAAPFLVASLGDRRNRISVAAGYAFKHHKQPGYEFDTNATIVAVGGDVTIARGWKIAAETYYIESSGLAPLVLTGRWFTSSFALDFGFGIDLGGGNDITTSGLSGEIRNVRLAPVLSAIWRFGL